MKYKLCVAACLILVTAQYVSTQIPRTLNYQGILTNPDGSPLSDGDYTLTFRIYDAETDGSALWIEEQTVQLTEGIFNVVLGEITPIELPFDKPYWLSLQVGDEPEMATRVPFTSVPYSFNSVRADTAQTVLGPAGGDLAGNFPDPVVAGIQGNPVAVTMPQDGQVLKWNAAANEWEPAADTTTTNWELSGDDIFRESGDVGIGTDHPNARLHVVGAGSDPTVALEDSGASQGELIDSFIDMNARGDVESFLWMRDANGNIVVEIDGDGNIQAAAMELDGSVTATGAISTTGPGAFSTVFLNNDYPAFIGRTPVRLYRNSFPIAYGYVRISDDSGVEQFILEADYGVSHVFRIGSGPGRFGIRLDRAISGLPVVIANVVDLSLGVDPLDRVVTFDPLSANNQIAINIADGTGNAVDADFNFVVFGKP